MRPIIKLAIPKATEFKKVAEDIKNEQIQQIYEQELSKVHKSLNRIFSDNDFMLVDNLICISLPKYEGLYRFEVNDAIKKTLKTEFNEYGYIIEEFSATDNEYIIFLTYC